MAPSKLAENRTRQPDGSTRIERPSVQRKLHGMRVKGRGSPRLGVDNSAELARLRVENAQLRAERDLLISAASKFIAKTARVLDRSGSGNVVTTPSAGEDVTVWLRGLA